MSDTFFVHQIADPAASRLAASNYIQNTLFYETDTGNLFFTTVVGGALVWVQLSTSTSSLWGKYVVAPPSGGGVIQPTTLYTTIAAAIAAAVADGHGPAHPAAVLVLPGTYTENLSLTAGIHVIGLGSSGGEVVTPAVTVVGQHAIANVAGTLELEGLALQSTNGIPLSYSGAAALNLTVSRCLVQSLAGAAPAIAITTANSLLSIDDSNVVGSAGAVAALSSLSSVLATDSVISAAGVPGATALILGAATFDTLRRCTMTGSLSKAGGSAVLDRCTIDAAASPSCAGNAVWVVTDVEAPSGLTFAAAATVTARKVARQKRQQAFAGAGPHAPTDAVDTSVVAPGANVTATLNLPDVTALVDGDEMSVVVAGSALGTARVNVVAAGGQTIGGGTATQLELVEGGSAVLRVDRSNSRWLIVALLAGTTGVISNPGGAQVQRRPTAGDLVCDTGGVFDYIVGVTSTAAPRTITLPPAASLGPGMSRVIVVKDESLGAGTNNITVQGQGGATIDGAATSVINTNGGSRGFYSNGTNWFAT